MQPTVLCVVNSHTQAEAIVEQLQAANIALSDISVLLLHKDAKTDAPSIKGLARPAKVDAEKGALAGGLSGFLSAFAAFTIPGLQPLVLAAPIAAAAGAAIGAAAGATVEGLADLGITKARQEYYQGKLEAGGFLVAVHTEDEGKLARANAVFQQAGGQDIALFRLTKRLS